MQNLQDIFDRIRATKREQKQIATMYRDALSASHEYRDLLEKLRGFKLRKKQIEDQVKAELGSDLDKLESLKKDVNNDKELLSDVALNKLVAGESVLVEDDDKNPYEPVFSVKFKKTNEVTQHTP